LEKEQQKRQETTSTMKIIENTLKKLGCELDLSLDVEPVDTTTIREKSEEKVGDKNDVLLQLINLDYTIKRM
jgi:hypothetical protein